MITFVSLTPDEVARVVSKLPEDVRAVLQLRPVVLAGGAVRDAFINAPVKDVDIFCRSEVEAQQLAELFGPATKSLNAWNVTVDGLPVQFVFFREFATAGELIAQFDFRACCAGVFWSEHEAWVGIAIEGFIEDCYSRRLTFMQQPKDAGSLVPLRRALKLVAKGWKIADEDVAGILGHWSPLVDREAARSAIKSGYGGRR